MTEKEKKDSHNEKYEKLKKEAEEQLMQEDNTYDDGTKVFLTKDECIEKGIEKGKKENEYLINIFNRDNYKI